MKHPEFVYLMEKFESAVERGARSEYDARRTHERWSDATSEIYSLKREMDNLNERLNKQIRATDDLKEENASLCERLDRSKEVFVLYTRAALGEWMDNPGSSKIESIKRLRTLLDSSGEELGLVRAKKIMDEIVHFHDSGLSIALQYVCIFHGRDMYMMVPVSEHERSQ